MTKMPSWYKYHPDLAMLLIRIGLASVFIMHGWAKLGNIEGTMKFFVMLGLPAFMAYVVGTFELVGGILLLLGLWVEITGWVLAVIMIFAIVLAKASKGFMGYEFELLLLLASVAVALTGSGKLSLSSALAKKQV